MNNNTLVISLAILVTIVVIGVYRARKTENFDSKQYEHHYSLNSPHTTSCHYTTPVPSSCPHSTSSCPHEEALRLQTVSPMFNQGWPTVSSGDYVSSAQEVFPSIHSTSTCACVGPASEVCIDRAQQWKHVRSPDYLCGSGGGKRYIGIV